MHEMLARQHVQDLLRKGAEERAGSPPRRERGRSSSVARAVPRWLRPAWLRRPAASKEGTREA
jgi:hypothetical protein